MKSRHLRRRLVSGQSSGWRELDKFVPNANRLSELHTLIDAVYEQRGLIIATTNSTYAELRADESPRDIPTPERGRR